MSQSNSRQYWIVLVVIIAAIALILLDFFDEDYRGRGDRQLATNDKGVVKRSEERADENIQLRPDVATPSKIRKGQSCASGEFVTGIDAYGGIQCAAMDATDFSEDAQESKCYDHGYIKDGFCQCDEGWTGAHCEEREKPKDPNAPPDNDFDNVPAPADCDDNNDMVYPGAPDVEDGLDNDCDGVIDEGYP